MKLVTVAVLLTLVLAGCADKPAKDAVIEDRGIKAAPVAQEAVDQAAAKAAEAARQAEAAKTEAAAGTPKPVESSQTRAVSQPPIEPKPIEGVKIGAEFKSSEADKTKPKLDPSDPLSPLAQRRVLFDYDSAAIREEFAPMLEAHAEYLKGNSQVKITLQGHTDERGSPEYNIALGQRRSEAVLKALNLLGVPDAQMEAVSFGEEKPVAEGHDESAWTQNRRTDIAYPNE
jgi:peptidoglycan-associated lipoprotein